ncbi:MAG: hypothetical protein JWQ35_1554 [Bacteriovoracaceae bacterium]|nr:hypothetical protein [Bacteriovoracaceae bacterium]
MSKTGIFSLSLSILLPSYVFAQKDSVPAVQFIQDLNSMGTKQNKCEPPITKAPILKKLKVDLPPCTRTSHYQDIKVVGSDPKDWTQVTQPSCHCPTTGWQPTGGTTAFKWKNSSYVYQMYECSFPSSSLTRSRPSSQGLAEWSCKCSDITPDGSALDCTIKITASSDPATTAKDCGCANSLGAQAGHASGYISECTQ